MLYFTGVCNHAAWKSILTGQHRAGKDTNMKIYVNDREFDLVPGMTVKHALIDAGLLDMIKKGKKVYDEMENEIGLSGELMEGAKIYIR
jgi:hypothetical protein